jgi:SAM-dependent methyltransferase
MPYTTTLELETVACNLCHSTDLEAAYDARADLEKDHELVVKFRASSDELLTQPLVKCRHCSLLFVNPRVPAALMLAAYAEGADPQYVSQMASRVRTFSRSIARIERLKPGRGRLLDVGTAAGAFLRAARDAGWDAIGIEPNRWLAEWGRNQYGVDIQVGTVDDLPLPEASFDVITLWDVIEHTPDPLHVLRSARRLLKPDGLLVVNYPDIGTWIARAMGRTWPFLSSAHLYYFTRDTMRAALFAAGFEPQDMRPHVQRLELDYLVSRSRIVSPWLSQIGGSVVRALKIGSREVPYWLGQTFVAARVPATRVRSALSSVVFSIPLALSTSDLALLLGA